jgi:hypothetical protein
MDRREFFFGWFLPVLSTTMQEIHQQGCFEASLAREYIASAECITARAYKIGFRTFGKKKGMNDYSLLLIFASNVYPGDGSITTDRRR